MICEQNNQGTDSKPVAYSKASCGLRTNTISIWWFKNIFTGSACTKDKPFHRNKVEDKACNCAYSYSQFRSCNKSSGIQDKDGLKPIHHDCANNIRAKIMNELTENIWPGMRSESVTAVDQPSDHHGARKRERLCSKCIYPVPSQ